MPDNLIIIFYDEKGNIYTVKCDLPITITVEDEISRAE